MKEPPSPSSALSKLGFRVGWRWHSLFDATAGARTKAPPPFVVPKNKGRQGTNCLY
jgi:hypothetical protein